MLFGKCIILFYLFSVFCQVLCVKFIFVFFSKNIEVDNFIFYYKRMTFLGKFLRYVLWLLLLSFFGALLFWLYKFDWNVSDYVIYLNQISLDDVLSSWEDISDIQDEDISLEEELSLDEEIASILEEDPYFFSWDEDIDIDSFGFSWSLDDWEISKSSSSITTSSSSKEELLDLIKLHEK